MKIGLISDTHCCHRKLMLLDDLDMIIHAGDCSISRDEYKNEPEVRDFISWFNNLDVKYKIWIAGNHDTSIGKGLINPKDNNPNFIYLQDEFVEIEGFKIWGSPQSPAFGFGWAFNMYPLELKDLYSTIPDDTDIIITHGPPKFYGDRCYDGKQVGSLSLTERIREIKPKLVVSGHIHEDRGIRLLDETMIVNAASDYNLPKEPIIIEI